MIDSVLNIVHAVPGLLLILGAALVPLLPQGARAVYMLALIAVSAVGVWGMANGVHLTAQLAGLDLVLVRATPLTHAFAAVFHIAAALNVIYALHDKSRITATAGLAYAGAAIAALFAGDFITLFIYWELTAFTSVLLILAGQNFNSQSTNNRAAAMRYLLLQVGSGVILLAGAVLLWRDAGASENGLLIGALDAETPAGVLILIALGIKAAFPLVSDWLQDAYPEASPTGTVMLSAFTTKLAIYMLATCFAGYDMLIYIGVIMAVLTTFYALIENDLRRALAYSLNGQLGIMVVGIGIGSQLAINGVIAHAFASTIYQGLLFMAMGAVLHRTGTAKASELGGLAKHMPLTMLFATIGGASIASVPLFSGFATKSLTLGAAAKAGHEWVWMAVLFASVGALLHSGLRLSYHAFIAAQRETAAKLPSDMGDAPRNMLVAMGIAAALCVIIGVYPQPLYALLPYEVSYKLWDAGHVLGEMQLLAFATLAFVIAVKKGFYPAPRDRLVLNTDWFLRAAAKHVVMDLAGPAVRLWFFVLGKARDALMRVLTISEQASRESGLVSGIASTGAAAGIFLAMFALMLLIRQIM